MYSNYSKNLLLKHWNNLSYYMKMSSSKKLPKSKIKITTTTTNSNSKTTAPDNNNNTAIFYDKSNNITIKIHAKPGAKQNQITDIAKDCVGIQIAAPPVHGEANTELLKYIAKILELKKSMVTLDKGSKSREKVITIDKNAITLERCIQLLQQECNDE